MPIDASIISGLKTPNFMSPADTLGIQNSMYRNQLAQMQMGEMQKQTAGSNALAKMLSQGQFSDADTGMPNIQPEQIRNFLAQNPQAAPQLFAYIEQKRKLQSQNQEAQVRDATLKKTLQETAAKDDTEWAKTIAPIERKAMSLWNKELAKPGATPNEAIQTVQTFLNESLDDLGKTGVGHADRIKQMRQMPFNPRTLGNLLGTHESLIGPKAATGPFSRLNPKDYTPESLKAYEQSNDVSDLVAVKKDTRASQEWSDPYPLQGAMVQKNQQTGEIRTAVSRVPASIINIGVKGAAGKGAPGEDSFAKIANLSPESDKQYRIQAWNYIDGKGLPYRKGSGGGVDRNDMVMAMAAKISDELGIPAQELAGKSAQFKADAGSFLNLAKKADVIEAQLESFHNNLDTWDQLAKGTGIKIGSPGSKALSQKLGKVNFTGIKSLDDIKLRVQAQFDDPATVAYITAASAAAFDYARIMSSQGQSAGQITDSARVEAQKLVSAGYDNKARAALMATLDSDTAGQIKGLEDQKNKVYGRIAGKRGAEKESKPSGKSLSFDDAEKERRYQEWKKSQKK